MGAVKQGLESAVSGAELACFAGMSRYSPVHRGPVPDPKAFPQGLDLGRPVSTAVFLWEFGISISGRKVPSFTETRRVT